MQISTYASVTSARITLSSKDFGAAAEAVPQTLLSRVAVQWKVVEVASQGIAYNSSVLNNSYMYDLLNMKGA